jgi:hypothetical protein
MKAVWNYVEGHHEQLGAALFIIPALLCAGALIGLWRLAAWAFQ